MSPFFSFDRRCQGGIETNGGFQIYNTRQTNIQEYITLEIWVSMMFVDIALRMGFSALSLRPLQRITTRGA